MPYVRELRSRQLSVEPDLKIEREFLVRGPTDEIEAEALLLEKIPQALAIPGRDFSLELASYRIREKGPKWFEAQTTYTPPADPTAGSANETFRLSFNVATESVHITQALKTIATYPRDGETAVNYRGVIGQTHDLDAQGCDILSALLSFDYTSYYPARYVTFDWVRGLSRVVGHPNHDSYKGFGPGELMCVGVTGAYRQLMRDWELSYSFITSPTLNDIKILGLTTISEKIGFDYLWVRYEKVAVEDGKVIIQRPLQANVERVYEFANYSYLGL